MLNILNVFKNETQDLLDKEAELRQLSDELQENQNIDVVAIRAELARERGALISQAKRK